MDQDQRDFIAGSPLLFIASRNAAGHLDVSPRGGQPTVLRIDAEGRFLLPDFKGNRRLDTLGNVLADPEVAILALREGQDRFVRVNARAEISTDPRVLRAFPADETPPLSVLVLTPSVVETVETEAFRRAGFWIGPEGRKPPLDALALLTQDRAHFDALGLSPVMKDAAEEQGLTRSGLRDSYGTSGPIVREKVARGVGPGSQQLLADVRLLITARMMDGRLRMDLIAEGSPALSEQGTVLHLPRPTDIPLAPEGDIGLLAAAPGRTDLLRLNGTYRTTNRDLILSPREVYLHCTASFSRARIWQQAAPQSWSGRRRFLCTAITDEGPAVKSFTLRPDDEAGLGPILPGQYVSVSLPADPSGLPRRRSYSVSGRPEDDSLRITVRRIGKGGLSDALHDGVQPGETLLLGTPAGRFVLDTKPGRPVVLVSAGVGITPLLPMLEALAAEGPDRDVWFVHGARDSANHLFRDAVAPFAGPRLRLVSAYSRPLPDDRPDHSARISAAMLATLSDPREADFYLCGPLDFMADLTRDLIALGADPAAVRSEAFEAHGGGPLAEAMEARPPCTVTFAASKRAVRWTPARGTLLDLAVSEGIEAPHSCRMGDCQSCAQRIVAGRVLHPAMAPVDLVQGQALMCQALPDGDVTIDC
ncbi:pyridoxamine 5'-phosphate oxidase family protein [Cereibacter sphaeroides]|nr:pyridoxamine 5'-phosphate oxidase family protein [Cereibacter sphaeroides]